MARKVVAVVLLGLLACAALASAQDTANQTENATKDAAKDVNKGAETLLDNGNHDHHHEEEEYNEYKQDKHDYKPHKHHKDGDEKEYEPKEHYPKAPKNAYKPSHDAPEYPEPEEHHMDLPHKLVKVPHMAKELEFCLDMDNFNKAGAVDYKEGDNWWLNFDLSYKGKTVGRAYMTGVVVAADKSAVAVNAEVIITSTGAWSEEVSMVTAAGLVVAKLDKDNEFAGLVQGGPAFVITGGLGAAAGAQGAVSFKVERGEGKPTATATFNITLPKQKPEKMNKSEKAEPQL